MKRPVCHPNQDGISCPISVLWSHASTELAVSAGALPTGAERRAGGEQRRIAFFCGVRDNVPFLVGVSNDVGVGRQRVAALARSHPVAFLPYAEL